MAMLQVIELMAVLVSALFGILLATRKHMDFVGLFAVGFAVAFGGGTLRDLFLDRHPLFWIANPHYPMLVFGCALIGAIIPGWVERLERYSSLPDALGLGMFTILGTSFANNAGCAPFVAVLIGVIAGTAGGVIGEIICNEVPSLFRPAPLCATCAFAGASLFVAAERLLPGSHWSEVVGAAVIVLFRLASIHWNLQLPVVHPHGSSTSPEV